MRQIKLPNAPNPDDGQFTGNALAYHRAIYQWMNTTKGKIEQASLSNDSPIDQPFVVTTGYTLTTAISGTSTGTQVANFMCSLVTAMTKKGLIKSVNINNA